MDEAPILQLSDDALGAVLAQVAGGDGFRGTLPAMSRLQQVCKQWLKLARGPQVLRAGMQRCAPLLLDFDTHDSRLHHLLRAVRDPWGAMLRVNVRMQMLLHEAASTRPDRHSSDRCEGDVLLRHAPTARMLLQEDARVFYMLDEELRNSEEMVLWAARLQRDQTRPPLPRYRPYTILKYVNGRFLNENKQLVKLLVEIDGRELFYVGRKLRLDREVVLAAVTGGCAGLAAAGHWRGDKEVVMAAVRRNPHQLKYALNNLRGDPEVVKLALAQLPAALQYASEAARRNEELVLFALERDSGVAELALPPLATAVDFWRRAVKVARSPVNVPADIALLLFQELCSKR